MGQYKYDVIADSTGVTNITLSSTGVAFPAGIATNGLQVGRLQTSANYTILDSDNYRSIFVSGSGTRTITLPDAGTNLGRMITIKKTDTSSLEANAVTVARAGSDVIDNALTSVLLLSQNDSITLVAEASAQWRIISSTIKNRWQQKILSADVTSNGAMSDLTFTTVVGRSYRVNFKLYSRTNNGGAGGDPALAATIVDGATTVANVAVEVYPSGSNNTTQVSCIFTAVGTSLTFVLSSASANSFAIGNGSAGASCVSILEELWDFQGTTF